jgi:hypothetical protein
MVLQWMFGGHFAGNVFSNGAAPGVLRQAGASPRNRCYEPAGSPAGGAGGVSVRAVDHDLVISGF